MQNKIKDTFNNFPKTFWVLILASFIDVIGGSIMFPFFAIYITIHFNVGMTQVGLLFTVFGLGGFIGNFLGGALTDKFGRKTMLLFGLISSGFSSILMGLVDDFNWFFVVAAFVGFVGNAGGPAQQAMITDLLPSEKQPEGFSILRVVINLAVTIGPAIGGLLAAKSYMFLFIADAVGSSITAVIVIFAIPETKPETLEDKPDETVMQTVAGYKEVFRNKFFMIFVVIGIIISLVAMQMSSSLSVFLLQEYDFPVHNFGLLISTNAIMVVILQFPVTRLLKNSAPLKVLAIGSTFYAIGFGMYGFVSTVPMFFVAMSVLTMGEIFIATFAQSIAASFAPEDKRGRYMAIFRYQRIIPTLIGALGAGLIMDNTKPIYLWYIAGILGMIAAFAYLILDKVMPDSKKEDHNHNLIGSN